MRSRRVLFVDDDETSRRVFARIMRRHGFIVDVASDGEEALELAQQCSYSVVATDQRMPGMAGSELVSMLREIRPESIYFIVTGDQSYVSRGRGSEKIVYKPWAGDELAQQIRNAILESETKREERIRDTVPIPQRSGEPVLLIEDNKLVAKQVVRLIEGASDGEFRIVQANSVSEAVDLLRTKRYSLILADLCLPDSQGIETVERLSKASNRAPLVVLSANSDEKAALQAVKSGAQDYIVKGELTGPRLLKAMRYAVERQQVERRVNYLAHHDQLTGLANRTLLRLRLKQALARSRARNQRVALLLLDLDRFKAVNDSLGHDVGDELLCEVGARLLGSAREYDIVARLGGDEFGVLMEDISTDEEVTRVAERIVNSFATAVTIGKRQVNITPSIGIAFGPKNASSVAELLKQADSAMYTAKDAGRNRYQFFSAEVHARAVQRVQLESELRSAIEHQEFILHYQPQVSLTDLKVVGVEALLRWQHPSGKLIPPLDFIPVLEESGLIVDAGEWLLESACRQIKSWLQAGFTDLRLAVNLSPRQFEDDGLVQLVRKNLTEFGVPGHHLELEITEGVLVRDTEATKAKLTELVEMGVRIAIDDFGTGYSSLKYLKLFPIHVLKIDRSFVKDIERSASDAAIAAAVIALGKALDLEVVAEGVETEAQVDFLRGEGCHMIQGYWISKPLPPENITELLSESLKVSSAS